MPNGRHNEKRAADADQLQPRGHGARRRTNRSRSSKSKFGLDKTELQQAKIVLGLTMLVVVLGILVVQWIR